MSSEPELASVTSQPHLLKTLRWHHGLVLALATGVAVFIGLGYTIGAIGAWGAIAIWGACAVVALVQNFLFAEMAAMFPEKPGGISLYAHEAWKRYFTPIGPLAAFGYWMGWSLALAIVGVIVGSLVQAQWFPGSTWTVSSGTVDLTLAHFIAIGVVVLAWLVNIVGIKVAVRINQAVILLFIVVIGILVVGGFAAGGWHSSNLTWNVAGEWGGWKTALVVFYVAAWSGYGSELCASFAPEYKNTARDTSRGLLATALAFIALYTLVPLAAAGAIGESAIGKNPLTYGVLTTNKVLGGAGGVVTAILCATLFVSIVSASADAARALYGLAKDDVTIKQLYHLNRFHMPGRALTIDLVVNVLLILFVGNVLGILFASNLGYILAVTLAVSGFVLLRKDRPNWPRPIRLAPIWVPIAVLLAAFDLLILVVGASNPTLAGYGGTRDVLIGLGLLSIGLILFLYRRLVQDRTSLHLREMRTDELPPAQASSEPVAHPVR